jgi:hypothetical protein
MGMGQQRAQTEQPDIPYRNVVDHCLGQPLNRRLGLADISVGFPGEQRLDQETAGPAALCELSCLKHLVHGVA